MEPDARKILDDAIDATYERLSPDDAHLYLANRCAAAEVRCERYREALRTLRYESGVKRWEYRGFVAATVDAALAGEETQ